MCCALPPPLPSPPSQVEVMAAPLGWVCCFCPSSFPAQPETIEALEAVQCWDSSFPFSAHIHRTPLLLPAAPSPHPHTPPTSSYHAGPAASLWKEPEKHPAEVFLSSCFFLPNPCLSRAAPWEQQREAEPLRADPTPCHTQLMGS